MTSGVFSPSESIPSFLEQRTGLEFANLGVIGQTSTEIVARVGATPTIVSVEGNTIPARDAAILTALDPLVINQSGPDLGIGNMPYQLTLQGTLVGVPGLLRREIRGGAPNTEVPISAFTFVRTEPGDPVPCPAGSRFVPTNASVYADRALIVRMGYNDRDQIDQIVADHRELLAWNTRSPRRVLILDPPVPTYADAPERARLARLSDALRMFAASSGCAFFAINAYVASEAGLAAAGITNPTAADLAAIAEGRTPRSASTDGLHYTVATNRAVAARLVEELRGLGYIATA